MCGVQKLGHDKLFRGDVLARGGQWGSATRQDPTVMETKSEMRWESELFTKLSYVVLDRK